jgi:hypothetical protein
MQNEVKEFYKNAEPSPDKRLVNIVTAAKKKPQAFLKGLKVLRDMDGNAVEPSMFGALSEVRSLPLCVSAMTLAWIKRRPASVLFRLISQPLFRQLHFVPVSSFEPMCSSRNCVLSQTGN